MSRNKIVLQSIDSPRRDFEWRLLVASRLSKEGFSSIIGSKPEIKDIHRRSRHCVFLGRLNSNTGRSNNDKKYLREMQDNNTALFFIHDEGGFYLKGEYEAAVKRIYPEDHFGLDVVKRIFFWGEAQRKVFNKSESSDKFVVSGFPRFDLYADKVRGTLLAESVERSGKSNEYVLVCSRFAVANMVDDDPNALGRRALQIRFEGGAPESEREAILGSMFNSWEKVAYEFSKFVPAVAKLAMENPSVNFVLRPHPAEKESFYKEAFSHFDNIIVTKEGDVRPLVFSSKVIIHSECTTGIEAAIAGKPNINFRPARNVDAYAQYSVSGVSDVGTQVEDYAGLNKALKSALSSQDAVGDVALADEYLHNLKGKELAVDVVVREIKSFSEKEVSSSVIVSEFSTFKNFKIKSKKVLKSIIKRDHFVVLGKSKKIRESKIFVFSDSYIKDLWERLGGDPNCIKIKNGVVYTYPCGSREEK